MSGWEMPGEELSAMEVSSGEELSGGNYQGENIPVTDPQQGLAHPTNAQSRVDLTSGNSKIVSHCDPTLDSRATTKRAVPYFFSSFKCSLNFFL